jgi:Na+-driven multidrug efflux pump
VVNRLCHFENCARVTLTKLQFSFSALGNLLRFGIPTAIHKLVFPLANLQIVSAINSFGVEAVAGNSAGASINNICHAFTDSFGITALTFMGQNIGAKQPERTRRSLLYCLLFGVGIGGMIGFLLHVTGEFWIGLVIGFSSTTAIEFGLIRSFWITQFMFIQATNAVLSHALQAYGYPLFSSINSIVFTLGFRIVWMQGIYPQNPTFSMIMLCFTVSWFLIMLFNSTATAILTHRYQKGAYKKI